MAAIFQNGRPKLRFSNISASSSLRIVILVSKHTYLGARIPIELIANTYLHEIGSHFPKWPTKSRFFNISASSSLGIVILVSKHTYLGARIPIELFANTYLYEIGSHFPKWPTRRDFFNTSASSSLGI